MSVIKDIIKWVVELFKKTKPTDTTFRKVEEKPLPVGLQPNPTTIVNRTTTINSTATPITSTTAPPIGVFTTPPKASIIDMVWSEMFNPDPLKRFYVYPAKYASIAVNISPAVAGDLFRSEIAQLPEEEAKAKVLAAMKEAKSKDPQATSWIETNPVGAFRTLVNCDEKTIYNALIKYLITEGEIKIFLRGL